MQDARTASSGDTRRQQPGPGREPTRTLLTTEMILGLCLWVGLVLLVVGLSP